MRYLTWLALLPMLAGPALANPPCNFCRVKKASVKKVYVDPVAIFVPTYVATIAPYAVAAPAYAAAPPGPPAAVAGPAPTYGSPQPQQFGALVPAQQAAPLAAPAQSELAAVLVAINTRLAALEAKMGGAPLKAAQPAGPPLVLRNKCAVCHQPDPGGAKPAGRLALFEKDGTLAKLTEFQLRQVLKHVRDGDMPPPQADQLKIFGGQAGRVVPPLVQEEADGIVDWILNQKGG